MSKKDAEQYVDLILDGKYHLVKEAEELTDELLDECGETKRECGGTDVRVGGRDVLHDEEDEKIPDVPEEDISKSKKQIEDELIEQIENIINESKYQEIFRAKMKEYGIKSPSELSKEEKKKFFNDVDKAWKSKEEKK